MKIKSPSVRELIESFTIERSPWRPTNNIVLYGPDGDGDHDYIVFWFPESDNSKYEVLDEQNQPIGIDARKCVRLWTKKQLKKQLDEL